MVTIYREKSAFRRVRNNILETFGDSRLGQWLDKHWQVWKTDRYISVGDQPIPIYRIRFWPIHVLQMVGFWLLYNAALLAWFMVSFMAGRSVSFTPLAGWHEPLVWFLELLK